MVMDRKGFLAAALLALCVPADAADPTVAVGSTRYPTTLTSHFDGKPVKMVLTGTALRTKLGFSVYTMGSYVQEGTQVRGPYDLASAAVPKQLCLAFEREVDGNTLARSFRDSIGMIRPAPAFAAELAALTRYMKAHPVKKGTCIWLSSTPGVGLRCQVIGAPEVRIDNAAFAQAVWEVYLGRKNLGVAIQTGLTSRL
jgi:Chalcone isomerase-like